MSFLRVVRIIGLALLIVTAVNAHAAGASRGWAVHWQPQRLVNGSPIALRVSVPAHLESLSGKWLEHDVHFSFDTQGNFWYAIAGVPLETVPRKYALTLQGKASSGKEYSFQQAIPVGKGKYRQIKITVPKQFTEPSPEQLKQIEEDKELKHRVFAKSEPGREWTGDFLPPVGAAISDVFGTARVFNGETQSVHQGLDFGVPQGTAVKALNRGKVVLAQPLFFEGGFVVLDHGQGLMSMYMHLSKIEVKEGDIVSRGQQLALSGGTGRATGPHLHIAVRWEGVYLDPAVLLRLDLPNPSP